MPGNRLTLCSIVVVVLLSAGAVLRPGGASADPTPTTGTEPLTLVTATPEEGFELALRLSRMGVTRTQTDREVLHALRPEYANDATALIAVSHVVAVHFQTVAAANDYWRR
jgi:hypothetical protein